MKRKRRKQYTWVKVLGLFIILIGLVGYFFVYRPFKSIQAKGNVLVASVMEIKDVAKQNDMDLLKEKVYGLETDYIALQKEAQQIYWASFIPHIADFRNGIDAAGYMIDAGKLSVDAIYPYADLIGFKQGEQSFSERSAEDRLQTAVLTLDKVLVDLDRISENIDNANQRIETIDPMRYPEKIGDREVRSTILESKEQFSTVANLFVTAKPFLKQLPTILGKDEEQTYLILFQNDNEQRATGGFLTAYAIMKINAGRISIERSEDIYSLDDSIARHPPAHEKIKKYHVNVNSFFIRDTNISPDFTESLKLFNSLYDTSSKKVDYDAIVAVDTKILVDMLEIFGETEAGGERFNTEPDDRCYGCPQVIYILSDRIGRPVGYIREDRKGLLGQLVFALFNKAIGFSPSQYWGPLAQTMFKNLDEKHILLYFKDPEVQAAVEALNYAGRIVETESDYLHVNNVNYAGAKSNLFVRKTLKSNTMFEGNDVTREVTVEFRNPFPHSDCNLERGGLCLNATLRNWIRVYVPEGSQLESFKGIQGEPIVYDELGKTVYEGFLTVPTEGKAEVTVTYKLPNSITPANYNVLIQKQAGEKEMNLEVTVNGKQKYNGLFETDTRL